MGVIALDSLPRVELNLEGDFWKTIGSSLIKMDLHNIE